MENISFDFQSLIFIKKLIIKNNLISFDINSFDKYVFINNKNVSKKIIEIFKNIYNDIPLNKNIDNCLLSILLVLEQIYFIIDDSFKEKIKNVTVLLNYDHYKILKILNTKNSFLLNFVSIKLFRYLRNNIILSKKLTESKKILGYNFKKTFNNKDKKLILRLILTSNENPIKIIKYFEPEFIFNLDDFIITSLKYKKNILKILDNDYNIERVFYNDKLKGEYINKGDKIIHKLYDRSGNIKILEELNILYYKNGVKIYLKNNKIIKIEKYINNKITTIIKYNKNSYKIYEYKDTRMNFKYYKNNYLVIESSYNNGHKDGKEIIYKNGILYKISFYILGDKKMNYILINNVLTEIDLDNEYVLRVENINDDTIKKISYKYTFNNLILLIFRFYYNYELYLKITTVCNLDDYKNISNDKDFLNIERYYNIYIKNGDFVEVGRIKKLKKILNWEYYINNTLVCVNNSNNENIYMDVKYNKDMCILCNLPISNNEEILIKKCKICKVLKTYHKNCSIMIDLNCPSCIIDSNKNDNNNLILGKNNNSLYKLMLKYKEICCICKGELNFNDFICIFNCNLKHYCHGVCKLNTNYYNFNFKSMKCIICDLN